MIADQFDAFFVDLDGVVYLGHEPLPDAVESLARLRERGAEIRFLTNDPTRTRADRRDLLNGMGVEAAEDEVVTASWATARYLVEEGVETVSVVGSAGLETELEGEGLHLTDEGPDAVVVGSDDSVDYGDIERASLLVQDGARFVATNGDATYPRPEGKVPGTGAIVSAVARTVETPPLIVGKPGPTMFDIARESLDADPVGDVLMLGDTPTSDVLGAHRAGHSAALVAEEPPVYPAEHDFRRPDVTVATLADLFDPERSIERWERPGFEWPDEVRAAVAAVVRVDGDGNGDGGENSDGDGGVLLERAADGEPWRLPLALVEPGETVAEAASRAAADHGVAVEVEGPSGVYSDPREGAVVAGPVGEATQLVTTCVRCAATETPAVDGEMAAVTNPTSRRLDPVHEGWLRDALAGGDAALD